MRRESQLGRDSVWIGRERYTSARLGYRADLDGLRAVAIVPVISEHLGIRWLPGGFVGVDVFFVISGFLISRLLVADLEQGTFSVVSFYDRRIRRIVPALAVTLVFCTIAAVLILLPTDLINYGRTLVATALSISNILFAIESGYFDPEIGTMPLLHSWSLAVEEQFYVFFPLFLWAMWRWAREWLPVVFWLVLPTSLALAIWGLATKPDPTFYLLPTRAWELLVGSVIALRLVPEPHAAWHRESAAAAGILAILTSMLFYTRETPFPGAAAILPCLGAALIIWAGQGQSPGGSRTAMLLGAPIAVFIGVISYSLYLIHWPLIVFAKYLTIGPLTPQLQVSLALATAVLAVISWRYIEQPLRAGGWPWPTQRSRFISTGIVICTFAAFGTGAVLMRGLPQRIPSLIAKIDEKNLDYSPLRHRCHDDGWPTAMTFAETCVLGARVPPSLIVFSDSHGAELSIALSEEAESRHASVRQITSSACPPSRGLVTEYRRDCPEFVNSMLSALSAIPPSTIIVTSFYSTYTGETDKERFWGGLESTLHELRKAGHSLVLLGEVPSHPHGEYVPSVLVKWVRAGSQPEHYRFSPDRKTAAYVEENIKRLANATRAIYVPLLPYLCPDILECRPYMDGAVMYFDDHHLSLSGARRLTSDVLVPIIWPETRKLD